jgi:hypothetical protein
MLAAMFEVVFPRAAQRARSHDNHVIEALARVATRSQSRGAPKTKPHIPARGYEDGRALGFGHPFLQCYPTDRRCKRSNTEQHRTTRHNTEIKQIVRVLRVIPRCFSTETVKPCPPPRQSRGISQRIKGHSICFPASTSLPAREAYIASSWPETHSPSPVRRIRA